MSDSGIPYSDTDISELAKQSRISKRKREENRRLEEIKTKLNLDINTPDNIDLMSLGEEQENEYLDGHRIEPLNMRQEIKEGLIDEFGVVRIENFESKPKRKKPKGYEESDSEDENDEWYKSIAEQGEKGIVNIVPKDKDNNKEEKKSLWDSPISALNELYDLLEDDDTLSQLLIRNAPKRKKREPRRSKNKYNKKQEQNQTSAFESLQGDEELFNRLMELSTYIMNEINVFIDDHKKEEIKKLIDKEKSKKKE